MISDLKGEFGVYYRDLTKCGSEAVYISQVSLCFAV